MDEGRLGLALYIKTSATIIAGTNKTVSDVHANQSRAPHPLKRKNAAASVRGGQSRKIAFPASIVNSGNAIRAVTRVAPKTKQTMPTAKQINPRCAFLLSVPFLPYLISVSAPVCGINAEHGDRATEKAKFFKR